MTLREAIELFKDHQKNSARNKTRESYGHVFRNLEAFLGDAALGDISFQDLSVSAPSYRRVRQIDSTSGKLSAGK